MGRRPSSTTAITGLDGIGRRRITTGLTGVHRHPRRVHIVRRRHGVTSVRHVGALVTRFIYVNT